ncbi:MAG: hypothetical protein ACQESA_01280 [Patescibacteria group bacterium]
MLIETERFLIWGSEVGNKDISLAYQNEHVRWASDQALERYYNIFSQQESLRKDSFQFIVPLSRGGKEETQNVVNVNFSLRQKYYRLFGSHTPQEVLDFLVSYFWGGRMLFLENYLSLRGQNGNGGQAFALDSFIQPLPFEDQINLPKGEKHHIVPSTRLKGAKNNTVSVNDGLHRNFHSLFINRTPQEILHFLVNYFWGDNILFLREFFFKKRDKYD